MKISYLKSWVSLYSFLFATFQFCSCSSDAEREKPTVLSLKAIDTLRIPIGKDVDVNLTLPDYFNLNNQEMIGFAALENKIHFYDINTRKLIKSIQVPKDGPNGVGDIELATIYSPDSIFIKPSNPFRFFLVDSTGKRLKTYQLPSDQEQGVRGVYSQYNNKVIYSHGELFAFLHPTHQQTKNLMDLNGSAFVEINGQNGASRLSDVKFPKRFWPENENWEFIHYRPGCTTNDKGEIVITFPANDSLYVYNPKTGPPLKQYSVKSSFQKGEVEPMRKLTMDALNECHKQSYAYFIIRHDPYRKLYYRVFLLPTEEKTDNNYGLYDLVLLRPFVIQIIDESFHLLGEQAFPAKTFNFTDLFVGRQGLYLSNNHPKNPNSDENVLSYTLFKVVGR